MLKLAKKISSLEDLCTLALLGLNIKDSTVDSHVKNKSDSITMAAYGVLKDWRLSQTNQQVPYAKMVEASIKLEMNGFTEALQ